MFNTDIFINGSLINTKKKLILIDGIRKTVQPCHFFFTSGKPAGSPLYRFLHIISVCNTAWTFVKSHGNGGCKIGLDLHTFLRTHKDFMSVNMRLEVNALLLDLAKLGKGKHLESAGICQDRFVPYHKLVKPAKLFYHFIARAHMKMIGIGKLYLSPNLMKIHGGHCAFDCTDGSYIHKYRGLYCAVDRMKLCPFCTPLCFQQLIFCHSSASSFCGNILTVFQYNLYCIKSKVYSQRKSCGLR